MKSKGSRTVWLLPVALSVWSALAVWFFWSRGYTLYYGDAESHLNIARRIFDSRTPGYDQIGTVWLPLLHVLLLPLVRYDSLWQSGLAGAIPPAACFVLGATFLFAAARRLFGTAAGVLAAALCALNPNLMYLQSVPMTETVFFGAFMALLYFSVRYRDTQGWGALAGAALSALAGTMARYDGWFVLPFVALYILVASRRGRFVRAAIFSLIAALGPLYWMAHNWYYFGNPLDFYNGPYSALAIQGAADYPGHGDWAKAFRHFRTAVELCAGMPLFWMGVAGSVLALIRRALWPVALLLLPGIFYVWSIHSSGNPIFYPGIWPNNDSLYNTRYGLALLPLLAFGAAALASWRLGGAVAAAVALAAFVPWLLHPGPENWITWKESQVNSESRRAWSRAAADYLGPRYHAGQGIATSFGDLTGIYRRMGLPLRETLTGDNEPHWMAMTSRPDLFLWENWAVVMGGDPVQAAINRVRRAGIVYELEQTIAVEGAPVIEIYKYARTVHESPRREE